MFTHVDDELVWQHVKEQRSALYKLLLTLSDVDWNQPSLCENWKIRDVIAHLIIVFNYPLSRALPTLIKNRARLNRFLSETAIRHGQLPTAQLLEEFEVLIDQQYIPFFVPPMNALVDTMIHEQDIRIPLKKPRPMDKHALELVFSHWQPGYENVGERITGIRKRTQGLQFQATDIQRSYGHGQLITGSAEYILLALAGRDVALEHLSGEGKKLLITKYQ